MQKITPVDIQHKTFKKALQGYDRTDVDQFLDEIIEVLEDDANQHAALEATIADLKERISHFKAMEESLQNTLVLAQRTADEVKASAHKEADLIKEQARIAAEKEVAHYNTAISDVKREHQRTTETAEKAKSELRSLLMTHLSLLEKTNPVLSPSQFVTREEDGVIQEPLLVEAAADSTTVDPHGAGGNTDRITVY
jgi:cell division initiation protein